MSEITNKIDSKFNESARKAESYLAYKLRDETGYVPMKIRITVFIKTEEGMHFTETENTINPDEFEEYYQAYVLQDTIEQAKSFIESEKKGE